MSIAESDAVVEQVDVARSDADLVARFVSHKEEAAFTELVRRHSSLVMGVCRRVLRDSHDRDDVFQATFLVFVRDAVRVKKQASLASWLYGVAYRLAVRVAQQQQRRRETALVDDFPIGGTAFGNPAASNTLAGNDVLTELAERYDQQLVDAELCELPERYRQVLVLRYLTGKTPLETAAELGITIGAVEGLLKRGKDELRARLMRRGVRLGAAVIAVQMFRQSVQAACPEALIAATVQTGLAWISTNPVSLGPISDRILELSGKELATMTSLTKAGLAIGLTAGVLALGVGGVGFLMNQSDGRANAGIATTAPVVSSASRGLVTTVLAAEPDSTEALITSGDAPAQPATPKPADAGNIKPARPQTQDRQDTPVVLGLGFGAGTAPKSPTGSSSTSWDFKVRSQFVQRIEKALTEPTEVVFRDTPLRAAAMYLADLREIEVVLDKEALIAEGIDLDQSLISLTLSGVSLKNVLREVLDPLKLDYVIQNDLLKITTRVKAESLLETRVYNVSRLPHLSPADLTELITETVRPDTWNNTGGEGVIRDATNTLVVMQSQRVHEDIVELLDQLEEQFRVNPVAPAATRNTVQKPQAPRPTAGSVLGTGGSGGLSPNPTGSAASKPTPVAPTQPAIPAAESAPKNEERRTQDIGPNQVREQKERSTKPAAGRVGF